MLLLFFAVGAEAEIITSTPQAGVQYKIKCIATDHTGYLGDDGTTLQGRYATGTFFILEATGTDGQYYLKSVATNKYINAAGVTSGSAISFDAEATTYWTLDQTNANTTLNSWAIRPNGTAGVSLNNNGSSTATCPYMKVNGHNSSGQGCNLWTFDDGTVDPTFKQPQFGGLVWTWNTTNSNFDCDGRESTAAPARNNNKGPVYKFVDAGTLTTAVSGSIDTSDGGGLWAVGSTTNVTSSLGRWAGSILVEDFAVASVSYSQSLKSTEAAGRATVWVNGTLNITGRTDFNMNDGNGQRWYIGEKGVINTGFTSVTRGSRTWDLQVVVADADPVEGQERVLTTLRKKVMTWGADLSSQFNSVTVWYKNAEGVLTELEAGAVSYDATGITITYEGLGYETYIPTLPEGLFIQVAADKAGSITPATAAADNAHWYVMTQNRGGESAMYDNGSSAIHRAAAGINGDANAVEEGKKYLVRFLETGTEGVYNIQFGTGNFVTAALNTGEYASAGSFKLYNINGESTHIGWNLFSDGSIGSIVDNDGAGNNISFWGSGEVTSLNGNNDWSIYPVSFIDPVAISYTLTAVGTGQTFTGSYVNGWANDATPLPTFAGADGYTLSDAVFTKEGDVYSMTANITFPFPVSTAETKNATGIESQLGSSKWYVHADGYPAASRSAATDWNYTTQDNYKWYIYPTLTDGTFSFKLQHHDGLYIPSIAAAQSANTRNPMVEEASAGSFYFKPCTNNLYGFSINAEGTIFLTINTGTSDDPQPIWAWTKGGSHQGSNLSFPDVTISAEQINTQFNALKNAATLAILEGSTVQGPSEFAAPAEINAAIAAAQAVADDDVEAKIAFIAGEEGQKIQTYLDAVSTYGALTNYQFEVKSQYFTLILPCPSILPTGITLYGCSAAEDDGVTLTLSTQSGNISPNVPYIVEATVGAKYTIIGWDKGSRETHTSGWLTGVLADEGATVPADSYVLARHSSGVQGFFPTDGKVTCPQYRCYLTVPSTLSAAAFFFPGGAQTGIESVFSGNDGKVTIYNLAGQKLNKLEKGINIVNGRKVLVK